MSLKMTTEIAGPSKNSSNADADSCLGGGGCRLRLSIQSCEAGARTPPPRATLAAPATDRPTRYSWPTQPLNTLTSAAVMDAARPPPSRAHPRLVGS
ncbi:unnamed protein product [Plutella xylostella]|uniref:(diamondback moth) hypothetical protein n=1 Tax=Plutella xylostella TaxID=51655 RepID=A0A8S4D2P6_PLUXY|nr:unnamed protein product [Plutella xylostella]